MTKLKRWIGKLRFESAEHVLTWIARREIARIGIMKKDFAEYPVGKSGRTGWAEAMYRAADGYAAEDETDCELPEKTPAAGGVLQEFLPAEDE
jgi:hypothetical protein